MSDNLGTVFVIAKSGRETPSSTASAAARRTVLTHMRLSSTFAGKLYGTTLAGGEQDLGTVSSRYPRPARKAYFTLLGPPPMA